MSDLLQYRRITELKYSLVKGEMKINMQGTDDNYYSDVDEIEINPNINELEKIGLYKNVLTMNFTKPIICNVNSGKYYSSMKCGTEIEGKNEELLIEKLDNLASRLDIKKDKKIQ